MVVIVPKEEEFEKKRFARSLAKEILIIITIALLLIAGALFWYMKKVISRTEIEIRQLNKQTEELSNSLDLFITDLQRAVERINRAEINIKKIERVLRTGDISTSTPKDVFD